MADDAQHILVLDDSDVIGLLARMTLESEGYKVHVCKTIPQAVAELQKQSFELIILDYNLQNGEVGFDLFRHLDVLCHKTPNNCLNNEWPIIIMLSAENDPQRKEMARDNGVKAWVTKPFSPRGIITLVHKLIDEKKAANHANT